MGSCLLAFILHRPDSPAGWQGSSHQLPCLHAPLSLLLSSKEIPAMPGSCRSRDSMLELESLDLLSPRRMGWCTGRRAGGTMRGLDSTVTSGMMASPTLSNTPLESTDSESLEVTISLVEDRPLLRTRM